MFTSPLSPSSFFLFLLPRICGAHCRPSLPLPLSSIPLHHSAVIRSPRKQLAVSWQTEEERDTHRTAEPPRSLTFTQALKRKKPTQMWRERIRICLLTFSSLWISSSLSVFVSLLTAATRFLSLGFLLLLLPSSSSSSSGCCSRKPAAAKCPPLRLSFAASLSPSPRRPSSLSRL